MSSGDSGAWRVAYLVSRVGGASETRHAGLLALEMLRGIIVQKGQQIIRLRRLNPGLFEKGFQPVDVVEENLVLRVNCRHARFVIWFPFEHGIE